jgi:hypothetical protein
MTVESTDRKQTYAGGQSAHTFTFRALHDYPEDIKVLKTLISTGAETDLTYTTEYSVAVADDGIGGVVTLNPTVSTLYTVTVYRVTTDKQESDYDDYNQFPADTLEQDFDRRTMISQERAEEVARTVKLPISNTGDATLPNPVANNILGWNAAADGLENKIPATLDFISVDIDGTLAANSDDRVPSQKAIKTYVNADKIDGSVNPTNLLSNGDFESWSAGASAAPDGWTLAGAGASVAREASIIKVGTYSAKLTRSGASTYLYVLSVSSSKGIAYWRGRKMTVGCWVYATVASRACVEISDATGPTNSSYHTGDSTWQWLTVTRTIDAADAGPIQVLLRIDAGDASAYFDGAMCVEGSSAFAFSPKPAEEGVWADYFATSTIVGWAAGKTGTIYTKKIGKLVFVDFQISGTSDDASVTFTVPYATSLAAMINPCYVQNSGTPAIGYAQIATSTITVYRNPAADAWTTSGNKMVRGQFFYESA